MNSVQSKLGIRYVLIMDIKNDLKKKRKGVGRRKLDT